MKHSLRCALNILYTSLSHLILITALQGGTTGLTLKAKKKALGRLSALYFTIKDSDLKFRVCQVWGRQRENSCQYAYDFSTF